jgi:hypothetical protein
MQIPNRLPGWKGLTIIWGLYGLAWIALEGMLWRVVLMGFLTTAVLLAYLVQKYLAGRTLSSWQVAGLTAVLGLGLGLGGGLLTLVFMAVKTGLHAHGPEFSPEEISWVWQQIPIWKAVGLLAGLGIGLIITQSRKIS